MNLKAFVLAASAALGLSNSSEQNVYHDTLLIEGLRQHNPTQVENALKTGANCNVRAHKDTYELQSIILPDGYTPLMLAIEQLGKEMVKSQRNLNSVTVAPVISYGLFAPLAHILNWSGSKSLAIIALLTAGAIFATRQALKKYHAQQIDDLVAIIQLLLADKNIDINAGANIRTTSALDLLNQYQEFINSRLFSMTGLPVIEEYNKLFDNLRVQLIAKGAKKLLLPSLAKAAGQALKARMMEWLSNNPFIFNGL